MRLPKLPSVGRVVNKAKRSVRAFQKPKKIKVKERYPELHKKAQEAHKTISDASRARKKGQPIADPAALTKAEHTRETYAKLSRGYEARYNQQVATRSKQKKVAVSNIKKVGGGVAAGGAIGYTSATISSNRKAKKKRLPNGWTPPPA